MTWAIVLFSALMLIWMVAGGNAANCDQYTDSASQAGCQAGTGIGIAMLMVLWFFGFIVLSILWFMTRPKGCDCPRCGESVKKGVMFCGDCGFDFRTLGQPVVAPMPPPAPPAAG
jgi:hypothetical protein